MALCNKEKSFELHVEKQESLCYLCPSQQHGWQLTENWHVWTLTHWTLTDSGIDSLSFLLYNYLFFWRQLRRDGWKWKAEREKGGWYWSAGKPRGETLFPLTNGELGVLCVMYGSYLVLDNNFVMEWSLQSHAPRLKSFSGWSWKSLSILIPDTRKKCKRESKRGKAIESEVKRKKGRHVNNQSLTPVSRKKSFSLNEQTKEHITVWDSTFWQHIQKNSVDRCCMYYRNKCQNLSTWHFGKSYGNCVSKKKSYKYKLVSIPVCILV